MKKIVTLTYSKGVVANTHLLYVNENDVICFDVGQEKSQLIDYLKKHNLNLLAIFLTHGHIDHIRGLAFIPNDIPIYIHKEDQHYLNNPNFNLSTIIPPIFSIDKTTINIEDEQIISFEDINIKCLHTPFHTNGSCCFLIDNWALISGDTLFHLSIGRSDLKGSNPRLQDSSLKKLINLNDDIVVYTGHSENTTIGFEKKKNPYLKYII